MVTAKPLCSFTKHVVVKTFTGNLMVKTNDKTKGVQKWLDLTRRRVVALFLSRKLVPCLADGFYPPPGFPYWCSNINDVVLFNIHHDADHLIHKKECRGEMRAS